MAIEFTESAAKHGFTKDDAIAAMSHPLLYAPEFDVSRLGPALPVSAWVGPARGGLTIEVFASSPAPRVLVVFHCMPVRDKTIRRIKEQL